MTLSLILQATVLFGLASLVGIALRRRSPALLHALDITALFAVLLLPLLTRFVTFQPAELSAIEIPAITMTVVGRAAAQQPIDWMLWIARLYYAGVAIVATRYLVGMARAFWLRWTSRPSAEPDVRLHRSILVPMTFGWLRPLVLLPESSASWPEERRQSAIDHERAHIARHDCLWNFVAEIACAVWWFHPQAWMLTTRARKSAEQAADNAVLRGGTPAADYAQHLLDVAREAAGSWEMASAIAMAEPSKLESRVVAVLDSNAPRMPLSRRALAVLSSVATVAALLVTGVINSPAQSHPAGTVAVTVTDISNARVPNALVSIEDGQGQSFKGSTNETGEVTISISSGKAISGDYLVQVQKPGFAIWSKRFRIDAEGATVNASLIPGQIFESMKISANGQGSQTPVQQIRVGGNVQAAKLINRIPADYPQSAKDRGIQGTVFLQAVILKDGRVGALEVLGSPDELLSQAATKAVQQWTYQPTLLNGNPIEVITKITINFTLSQ